MPQLVQSLDQVLQNAKEWASVSVKPDSIAFQNFSRFSYWYYFPTLKVFAPNKFIGYVGTTIENYQGGEQSHGAHARERLHNRFLKIEGDSLEPWRIRLDEYATNVGKPVCKKTYEGHGGVFVLKDYPDSSDDDGDDTQVRADAVGELWARFERRGSDLKFNRQLFEALHLGLWAHPQRHFAVLSGLSGTGKTQLALEYGNALTNVLGDNSHVEVVSVHPGWHDPAPLLGYVNPLTGEYSETECLKFLLAASKSPGQAYVLILDEMNLSHPEQYLAPILSAMEIEGGTIPLHRVDDKKIGVPTDIQYPANLVVIGTVNMDETTMGISDKVLDRAFTLEFWDVNPDEWPGWDRCGLDESERDHVRQLLTDLSLALSPARRHFGWRVIGEVVGFLEGRTKQAEVELDAASALDQVVYAKVLPKLRGDDTKRFRVCLEKALEVLEASGLPKCQAKVQQLKEDMEATGSCSFWR